ncbi:MAG: hypothetical protein K9J16_12670 [Melioribacteraceae bacterium]|nr:hypothetical protein [Melioribacteraceae bacterium]MCF8356190.1 hypothetical protein [Melioribacteraceae bacterium]MCF8394688.1 hypothetical protein [Melioribacteraceae bacterium]MCF8420234.1 hypothetical protein [Melioribacteraceae bacterium]
MKITKMLLGLFMNKLSNSAPLVIIKKGKENENVREYNSIEEAIADLDSDPNVSKEKIEKLKSSLKSLKNKTSITIRNGEII